MSPVALSLVVGLTATLLSLPPGVAVAWYLERGRGPLRGALQALVMLPLVLPPVVTGFLLLMVFSRRHWLGRLLDTIGTPVAFGALGAVVAAAVVGFPLLVMSVSLAMKSIDPRFESVARSLGRTSWETFWRVTLPLTWPGILSGAALSFARGLGEFGATIVLAGRIPGRTETIPLAIYARLDQPGGEERVLGLVAASLVLCVLCVVVSRRLDLAHRRRLELAA
jgi:molybdate transport system permease protein